MPERIPISETTPIEQVRRAALDRIERSERKYKLAFYGAILVEAGFLLTFVLLADFSNRLHVLLLIAAVAVYTIVALGLSALGAHVSKCTERILKAVELLDHRSRER